MQWIDAHVHFFGGTDHGTPPYVPTGKNHTVEGYLACMGTHKPQAIVSVDFSKAPDATHVVRSLASLKAAGIPAKGIVRGNPDDPRTCEWLGREDVAGIRLYAVANCPDISGSAFHRMFNLLRNNKQHICVFGTGQYLHGLLAQLPEDITLLIDHLGMGDATKGNDPVFAKTLALLRARQKRGQSIYLKGPGYRSGGTPKQVAEHIAAIAETLGTHALIMGATDAPFAGFADRIDYPESGQFAMGALAIACEKMGGDIAQWRQAMIYDNAKQLYGF